MEVPNDCKGCGQCCIWETYKDIPIHPDCDKCPTSEIKLLYGRCEKLNEKNECSIYEDRPVYCRIDRGGHDCLSFLESHEKK